MDQRQLVDLLRRGTPLATITDAITYLVPQVVQGWDLTAWRWRQIPGAVLLWQVGAGGAFTEAQVAQGRVIAQLAADKRVAEAEARDYTRLVPSGGDFGAQMRANRLDHDLSAAKLHPDAPPDVRAPALVANIAGLRRHLEQVRAWRREYGDADAARLGPDEAATEATIAAREAELAAIPALPPLAGIMCVNAGEERRAEIEPLLSGAGYPCVLLLRGEFVAGQSAGVGALIDGVLR